MKSDPRWQAPPWSELAPAQRAIYADIEKGERGSVPAPLKVWLTHPTFATAAERLGTYCRFGSSLPARLSELAILIVGAHWRASFEWSTHAPIALRSGVGADVIDALRTGGSPVLRDDERAVYEFARQLLEHRRVSDAAFNQLKSHLKMEGVVDVVAILGYYSLICMTINVFEIPNPAGTTEPFPTASTVEKPPV